MASRIPVFTPDLLSFNAAALCAALMGWRCRDGCPGGWMVGKMAGAGNSGLDCCGVTLQRKKQPLDSSTKTRRAASSSSSSAAKVFGYCLAASLGLELTSASAHYTTAGHLGCPTKADNGSVPCSNHFGTRGAAAAAIRMKLVASGRWSRRSVYFSFVDVSWAWSLVRYKLGQSAFWLCNLCGMWKEMCYGYGN